MPFSDHVTLAREADARAHATARTAEVGGPDAVSPDPTPVPALLRTVQAYPG